MISSKKAIALLILSTFASAQSYLYPRYAEATNLLSNTYSRRSVDSPMSYLSARDIDDIVRYIKRSAYADAFAEDEDVDDGFMPLLARDEILNKLTETYKAKEDDFFSAATQCQKNKKNLDKVRQCAPGVAAKAKDVSLARKQALARAKQLGVDDTGHAYSVEYWDAMSKAWTRAAGTGVTPEDVQH